MATRKAREPENRQAAQQEQPRKRSFTLLWVTLACVSCLLFVGLLHAAGALRSVEEAVYQGVKGVPVIGFLATPLHKESWEGRLKPDQVVDVKDLRRELIKTENRINDLKGLTRKVSKVEDNLEDVDKTLGKISKDVKDLKEGAGMPVEAEPGAGGLGAAQAMAAPAIARPGGTMGSSSQGLNYRAISKIFEKVDAETTVDILNNMTDQEKVEILSAMKEKTVADIFAAMEPTTAAELSKMLAARKSGR